MSSNESPWDQRILDSMKPGCVTFGWDDGEIATIEAPEKALDTMQSAWEWIDVRVKDFEEGKGKPRTVCFRLASGEFRGLKFPDWNPGAL